MLLPKEEEDPYVDRIRNRINPVSQPQSFINRLRNRFYKPATSAAGGYNVSQLNQMNALGGYYSEPARDQRRTQKRKVDMLARRAAGKPIGTTNLGKITGRDEGRGSYTATTAPAPTGVTTSSGMHGGRHYNRGGLAWPR